MKLRFLIYGSLLFITLALPVVYKSMEAKIQKQEMAIRAQKKNWLYVMAEAEFCLTRSAKNLGAWKYHFNKALDYSILFLEMAQEDIDNLTK